MFSYKSTITNLKLHMKKNHIGVHEEFCRRENSSSKNLNPLHDNINPSGDESNYSEIVT